MGRQHQDSPLADREVVHTSTLLAMPEGRMEVVEIGARVGGRFRIAERRGEALADHVGAYLELDRPRRLFFTLGADDEGPPTRVEVDIVARGGACTLTLTHHLGPAWPAYADRAREGWAGVLENLASRLGQTGVGGSDSPGSRAAPASVRTAPDHEDGRVGRDELVARHAAPGGQILRRTGVARDDLDRLAGLERVHAGGEPDHQLPAPGLTDVPSLAHASVSRLAPRSPRPGRRGAVQRA